MARDVKLLPGKQKKITRSSFTALVTELGCVSKCNCCLNHVDRTSNLGHLVKPAVASFAEIGRE